MNAKLLVLASIVLSGNANAAVDPSSDPGKTAATAAYCESCHGSEQNNDMVTDPPRETRIHTVDLILPADRSKATPEQGVGTGK